MTRLWDQCRGVRLWVSRHPFLVVWTTILAIVIVGFAAQYHQNQRTRHETKVRIAHELEANRQRTSDRNEQIVANCTHDNETRQAFIDSLNEQAQNARPIMVSDPQLQKLIDDSRAENKRFVAELERRLTPVDCAALIQRSTTSTTRSP